MPTIRVNDGTWKELNKLKEPGESFDDVISRLLDSSDGDDDNGN